MADDNADLTEEQIFHLALEKMIAEGKVQSYYDPARRMMMFKKVGERVSISGLTAHGRRGPHCREKEQGEKMYKIVRNYLQDGKRTIKTGLTLAEAQAHCRDLETSSKTATSATARRRTATRGPWFDGYEECRR